ncbi:MAG: hypothetical protein CM15mP23_10390 [Cryomorphaceae bacterium]|nr:MAG: hypothetical protein CM15mP23_10390 [Cryomorphaceae bacterium]
MFTASYALKNNFDDFKIKVEGESGRSELTTENDPMHHLLQTFFIILELIFFTLI